MIGMTNEYKDKKRMRDAISYRVTDEQRASLERYAENRRLGLCEAARRLMDLGIQAAEGAN